MERIASVRQAAVAEVLPPRMRSTPDREHAGQWLDPSFGDAGIEGVVAKPLSGPYRRGQASGWIKIRHLITTEVVAGGVAGSRQRSGVRVVTQEPAPAPASPSSRRTSP